MPIMIAWPWYLLSAGIVLIIIGFFMTTLSRLSSRPPYIDPKMSNKEIKRVLSKSQKTPIGNILILFGLSVVFVSMVWRLVLSFLSYMPPGR